jgi:hypothetical protein
LNLWFFFPNWTTVFSPFSMYNKCLVFLVYFTCNNGMTKSKPSWLNHAYYWAIVAPNWSCLDLNIFKNQYIDIFYFIWMLFRLLLKEYSCWIQDNGVMDQHEGAQHKCQKMW